MSYTRQQITSAGLTLDNIDSLGFTYDVLAYTTAPVTLLGNVVINPTVTVGNNSSFSLRGEANLSISTFSVVIVGKTLSQDQVNQTGTFSCYYDGADWSVQYFADGKDQPQAAQGVTNIPVPVGGTKTLVAGVDTAYQRLVGSPTTLSSNYTVIASTIGIKAGSQFQIEIAGDIIIGSNTLTVFGISINANQALNGGVIVLATFDGISTWVAASTSRPVSTADIDPVTALSVMGNDTSSDATPIDIEFTTDYGVLQRNGTTLTTGLLTANSFDPTSVVANKVSIVSLTSAQILNLNTAPVMLVPSSGVNTVNVVSSVTVACTFVTTAYTANTDASVYFPSASDKLYEAVGLLAFASSGVTKLDELIISGSTFQYVANEPLYISAVSGNPLTGDSTCKVTVIYQTIAL